MCIRKHWHALSHSLHFARHKGDWRYNSVCLGLFQVRLTPHTLLLHVTAAHFFVHFLPLLRDYDVKRPILTFYGGREHMTTVFIFFS